MAGHVPGVGTLEHFDGAAHHLQVRVPVQDADERVR